MTGLFRSVFGPIALSLSSGFLVFVVVEVLFNRMSLFSTFKPLLGSVLVKFVAFFVKLLFPGLTSRLFLTLELLLSDGLLGA